MSDICGAPHTRDEDIPELLAPAGGPAPFRAALAAGADAIYCGLGNDFNARRGADNFDEDSFAEACRAAHLAGARVYVTVNVVIRNHEMTGVLNLIRRATVLGADAFIVQDWGLMQRIRELWPNIELHVSTQANIHDARGVAWCRDEFGAHRVTLSRELSLPEIATCSREGVELEVFGHGALCFCYSGVCLMSSMVSGRSANRGLCAQPCRLPHDLMDEHGHIIAAPGRTRPLCPKDACSVDALDELTAAGAGALKVEGRMKAPDYVYSVVGAYREALDALGEDTPADETTLEARHRRLKRAFNRDFTDAYLRGTSGDEMMSYGRSNNRGETVGTVVASRRDGNRSIATIELTAPADRGDLLELRHPDDEDAFLTCNVSTPGRAGERIECVTKRRMPTGCVVRLIRSQAAMTTAAAVSTLDIPRTRAVNANVVAELGQPLRVTLTTCDGRYTAQATGPVVEAARTRSITAEDLAEHVGRMGGTCFVMASSTVALDEGVGMAFSVIHKVRAQACEALEQAILAPYANLDETLCPVPEPAPSSQDAPQPSTDAQVEVCAIVSNPQVARAALDAGATRLYATAEALEAPGWPAGVVPVLDEVCRASDHSLLDPLVRSGATVAVGNVSELALAVKAGASPEVRGCIPVHNEECLGALERRGVSGVWLSPELTLDEICELASVAKVPMGVTVMGRPRVMTSEHCVLQAADECVHDCVCCELRGRKLSLRNVDGKLLPVRTDERGRSRIYDAFPLDATPQVPAMVEAGVARLAVDATLLDERECTAAVERVVRAVESAKRGVRPAPRMAGTTSGHLFMGIG